MEKAVYKMNINYSRMGNLEGIFVAPKSYVKIMQDKQFEVYFGEVLGKHSEVYGVIDENELKMVSDNPEVVKVIEENDLTSGYNPFDYTILGSSSIREYFEDLTMGEICEILEKESVNN